MINASCACIWQYHIPWTVVQIETCYIVVAFFCEDSVAPGMPG